MINFNQFFVYHLVKKVFAKLRETFSKIIKNSKVQKKPVENLNINTIKFKNKTINILSTLFGLLIIAAIFYISYFHDKHVIYGKMHQITG